MISYCYTRRAANELLYAGVGQQNIILFWPVLNSINQILGIPEILLDFASVKQWKPVSLRKMLILQSKSKYSCNAYQTCTLFTCLKLCDIEFI